MRHDPLITPESPPAMAPELPRSARRLTVPVGIAAVLVPASLSASSRDCRAHRSRTVVLLGIDGAGKTTTAAALAAAERESGRPAIVLRNRSGRRWLARVSARVGLELPVRWADRFETVVRTVNVLVSQARGWRRGGVVVVDRHLVCQLVLRRVRGLPPGRLLPWVAATLLRGDTVVVLDVPAEIAHARILTRGEDLEPLDHLRTTRATYLEFARDRGWKVVDGTGATGTVVARVADAAGP